MSHLTDLTEQAFKNILPDMGFPLREPQYNFAINWASTIAARDNDPEKAPALAMIEAGTGTGKTLGYLIPAALYGALTKSKIGISTHTLALQDQLFGRAAMFTGQQPVFIAGEKNSDLAIAIEVVRRLLNVTPVAGFRKGRQTYLDPTVTLKMIDGLSGERKEDKRVQSLKKWAELVGNAGKRVADAKAAIAKAKKAAERTDNSELDMGSEGQNAPATTNAGVDQDAIPQAIIDDLKADRYQGLIAAYMEEHAFPPEFAPADVAITENTDVNPWYRLHADGPHEADLVVYSHAMSLFNLISPKPFLPEFSLVVHDECDTMPSVAEGYSRTKVRPLFLENARSAAVKKLAGKNVSESTWNALDALGSSLGKASKFLIEECGDNFSRNEVFINKNVDINAVNALVDLHAGLSQFTATLKLHDDKVAMTVKAFNALHGLCKESVTNLADMIKILGVDKSRQAKLTLPTPAEVAPVDGGSKKTKEHIDFRQVGMSWSPQKRFGSFEMVNIYPGHIFNREWLFASPTHAVLLTSATMRVPGTNNASPWVHIKSELGVKNTSPDGTVISVRNFGSVLRMHFLTGTGKPFIQGEEETEYGEVTRKYDPAWLEAAAGMLRLMADTGHKSLVLAASFRDVIELKSLLSSDGRFYLHDGNETTLAAGVEALRGKHEVLVTPSAWAGANIRRADGGQLFHNLGILRLPIMPPDNLMCMAYEYMYICRGLSPDEAKKKANNKVFSISMNRGLHKFTQGFGRGIRAADDWMELWAMDPRFPVHDDLRVRMERPSVVIGNNDRRWHKAIPERFQQLLNDPDVVRVLAYSDGQVAPAPMIQLIDI